MAVVAGDRSCRGVHVGLPSAAVAVAAVVGSQPEVEYPVGRTVHKRRRIHSQQHFAGIAGKQMQHCIRKSSKHPVNKQQR